MIDFSTYTLPELQAVVEVLDLLTDEMAHSLDEMNFPQALAYYLAASAYESRLVNQQAREAGEEEQK